jgi:predicted phosphodiesterase
MAGNKPTLKQKIVREYIKKFPKISNYALANKILKEQSLEFDNVENIRTMIRYVTGSNGTDKNKEVKDKSLFRPARASNDYLLPQSYANDFTPYEIKQSRILIISDLHFPYQNNEAITLALDYGKEKKVDCIILNGDVMDQANISRHERDWRARSIAEEFEAVRVFLKSLRLHFPKTKIVWKLGNHEERWEKFLYNKAPEIFDVNDFQLEVLLKLGELKIEIVKDKRPIILGKLTVLHGHELMGMGGVNPARATFTKTMEDTLVGHYHRTSSHSEPTMNNKLINVHSQGCLCEMNPMFMPINKWNLGFAYVDLNIATGEYFLENKKIVKGKVY